MNGEFKNNPQEYKKYDEYQVVKENPQAQEYQKYNEFVAYEENNEGRNQNFRSSSRENKKQRALASMSTGVVSAIAVAALSITNLINVSMNAEFKKVEYIDGQINYDVEVEKMTEAETLYAYIYDGQELKDQIYLIDDDNDGKIVGSIDINADLQSKESTKHSYRLTLAGDVGLDVERKFDSYVIEIENKVSSFNSLSGECHCGEDGYYYFNMDFNDDQGIFKDFEATITDSFGNIAICEFNNDLHSTQKIYVLNLKGSSGKLILSYTADGEKQSIIQDITM